MRVAHREDYDTHAVVGGREVMEFGIAQTAEFFTVLSSTLYTDKPLAVVREVLCNAWDSHIASRRTDRAVVVTINDTEMVIRDFGRGIAPSKMHPIYCVYGASTKENDGEQTGGFGLGSKAPFAYSDHFTVTSCHGGTKTVYAISRGSALTKGKPDLRVMVRVPTEDEGLEVSIPLKETSDRWEFERLVKRVASQGDMNVTLNGKKITALPLNQAKDNVFLTTQSLGDDNYKIFVRYGNVIYPLTSHADYARDYAYLIGILSSLGQNSNSTWRAVLQAPANAITVTPSRESLSLTETTIATLGKLLADLSARLNPDSAWLKAETLRLVDEAIDLCFRRGTPHLLLEKGHVAQALLKDTSMTVITSPEAFVRRTLLKYNAYQLGSRYYRRHIEALIQGGYRRRHDLICMSRLLLGGRKNKSFHHWFTRPLLKKLATHDVLQPERLLLSSYELRAREAELRRFPPLDTREKMALLQGVVILTYSKQAMGSYQHRHFPDSITRLLYAVPRKKPQHHAAAVAFFTKLGFHVIDHTKAIDDWDARMAALPKEPKAPKKVKPVGLPALSNLVNKAGSWGCNRHLYLQRNEPEKLEYVAEPVCIFQPHDLSSGQFFEFGDNHNYQIVAKDIIALIGHEAGIVASVIQREKWIEQGVKCGYDHLAGLMAKEILTNPVYKAHLGLTGLTSKEEKAFENLMSIARACPKLIKRLGLPPQLSQREGQVLRVFRKMAHHTSAYPTITWQKKIASVTRTVNGWDLPRQDPLRVLVGNLLEAPAWKGLDLQKIADIVRVNPDVNIARFFEDIILKAHKV